MIDVSVALFFGALWLRHAAHSIHEDDFALAVLDGVFAVFFVIAALVAWVTE